ncbi:MAG: UvrD-helicase domain-containing protein [Sphaerochaetaceae bacterium]
MICEKKFMQSIQRLDTQQRQAVFCDRNCVVSAGAGSGKTTVLAYRFLRLVCEGKAHADEILTLTFTRLAAAQMHERIHQKLLEFKEEPMITQELTRFPDAVISTLDSFCKRIVGADSIRYGIPADFVLDDEANTLLARECALSLLDRLQDDPGVVFLATVYKPDELVDTFLVRLACECFHPSRHFDPAWATQTVVSRLRTIFSQALAALAHISQQILATDGNARIITEAQRVCSGLLAASRDWQGNDSLDYPHVLAYLEALSLSISGGGKDASIATYKDLARLWRTALQQVKSACAALRDQPYIGPLYRVLGQFEESYLQRKRHSGILTFADISEMAVDILIHNKAVRAYYKKRFRYVMIDEFQDNNQLQKNLLYLLSEQDGVEGDGIPLASGLNPEKMFFVGDEKQSIYRFRGADVGVFKQLSRELEACGGLHIELATNYRSEPGLIEVFNQLFPAVMANDGEPYEADFSRLCPREPVKDIVPSVSLWVKPYDGADGPLDSEDNTPSNDEEQLSSVEAEAYMIASLIARMTTGDDYAIASMDGKPRRPLYADIAILFRSSSNQLHYEKALRTFGIPYTLAAIQSLFLEAPTNDLYQMLQLLLYPSDRKAYIAALRSPFCHLDDMVILRLLDTMQEETPPFGSLGDDVVIPLEERDKYEAASALFSRLLALVGEASIAQLISFLWYDGGYRYLLLSDASYQVYLEHVEYLLELARSYDASGKGLAAFLDFIRPRLGENEKLPELEVLREDTGGVHLMTIHKSKGLEFPIVILANMGSKTRPGSTPSWYSIESERGRVPVPIHMRPYGEKSPVRNLFHMVDKPLLEAREVAEMKRLLYVAVTRAKTHLVLTGCENRQNRGSEAYKTNLLAMLRTYSHVEEDDQALGSMFSVHRIEDAGQGVLQSHVSRQKIQKTVESLRSYYATPQTVCYEARRDHIGITALGAYQPIGDIQEIGTASILPALEVDSLVAALGLSTEFGSWCHAILQQTVEALAFPYGPTSQGYPHDPVCVMPEGFRSSHISAGDRLRIGLAAVELADRFLQSALFAHILAGKPVSLEAETRFYMMDTVVGEELLLEGSIDFVAVYPDMVRIVDFKTDSIHRPQEHARQLSLYRKAATRIWKRPVISTLCYLRKPGGEEWEA